MDGADLAADVAARWERTTAVDALLDAIDRNDSVAVQSLASDAQVRSALDAEEWTRLEVLSCLAASGNSPIMQDAFDMIRAQAHLVHSRFSAGQTLLHRAARAWSLPFSSMLFDLGADPNVPDIAGHVPLYYAGNRFPRPPDVPEGLESTLVELFCKFGANLDAAYGVKRCTALHMSARRGHAALAHALVSHGANIEARDSNGESPLRRSVNCGHPAVATVLLSLGADPESRCNRGRTPRDAARTDELRNILGS